MSFKKMDVYRIVLFKCLIAGIVISSAQQVTHCFVEPTRLVEFTFTKVVTNLLQRSKFQA